MSGETAPDDGDAGSTRDDDEAASVPTDDEAGSVLTNGEEPSATTAGDSGSTRPGSVWKGGTEPADRPLAAALDAPFAVCLTHDVDRPFKRAHQSLYFALAERRLHHLRSLLPGENPYWQFEEIMAVEEDLGVRSAFYFLAAPALWSFPPREWLRPDRVVEHLGRYDVDRPPVADAIRRLEEGGWEVGLHGSRLAAVDRDRLEAELNRLDSVLEGRVVGCRHHHFRVELPETLRNQAALGLAYDASVGSTTDYGFEHGDGLRRPVPDGPVELPLTVMETSLPDPGEDYGAARDACDRLLREARDRGGLMTALWHPRYFCETDFPGYRSLYRDMVETALDMGAWVGSPRDLLSRLDDADRSDGVATERLPSGPAD